MPIALGKKPVPHLGQESGPAPVPAPAGGVGFGVGVGAGAGAGAGAAGRPVGGVAGDGAVQSAAASVAATATAVAATGEEAAADGKSKKIGYVLEEVPERSEEEAVLLKDTDCWQRDPSSYCLECVWCQTQLFSNVGGKRRRQPAAAAFPPAAVEEGKGKAKGKRKDTSQARAKAKKPRVQPPTEEERRLVMALEDEDVPCYVCGEADSGEADPFVLCDNRAENLRPHAPWCGGGAHVGCLGLVGVPPERRAGMDLLWYCDFCAQRAYRVVYAAPPWVAERAAKQEAARQRQAAARAAEARREQDALQAEGSRRLYEVDEVTERLAQEARLQRQVNEAQEVERRAREAREARGERVTAQLAKEARARGGVVRGDGPDDVMDFLRRRHDAVMLVLARAEADSEADKARDAARAQAVDAVRRVNDARAALTGIMRAFP